MAETKESMKLFGRWSYDDIKINDPSLQNYIALEDKRVQVYVPHTAGRYQIKKFRKAQCPIIERVLTTIQHHGRNSGKKVKAMRIMRQAMELIELQTGENPIQVSQKVYINPRSS
jgi:small subunit ribosomal protein S5e